MSHDELDIGSSRVSRLCRRERRSERASSDTSDEIGLSGPLARLQNVICPPMIVGKVNWLRDGGPVAVIKK